MLGARAAIDKILAEHDHVLNDPAPFVEVETLKDSSVDFLEQIGRAHV